MKHYTFLKESIKNDPIKDIVKKCISDACQCRTIIEAKIILGRGYQKSIILISSSNLVDYHNKYLNILEHTYLTIDKCGNSWKNYLKKILEEIH